MRFKILYVLFLIISVMFSRFMLFGPISLRHVLTIAVFVYCIAIGEFKIDRFIKLYLVFLAFYALSNIIFGYSAEVLKKLFGTYFPVLVLYLSTKIMIQKYDGLNWVVYTIISIAILDAVVTIGQFYNNPIARTISEFLHGDEFNEDLYDYYERHEDLHGMSAAGVLGAVINGYFLSAVCILGLYNKSGKLRINNWAMFMFLAFALFLVQERSGLYFGLFCAFIYMFLTTVGSKKSSFSLLLILPIIFLLITRYGSSLVSLEDTRYATHALDQGGREILAYQGWEFVSQHPLGGIMEFHALGNRDSHNLVTNAFLFGGIFGGIVVLLVIIAQLGLIIKILYKSFQRHCYSFGLIAFSLMYLDFTLNALFHNASLIAGTVFFFVTWGVVRSLYEKENIPQLLD